MKKKIAFIFIFLQFISLFLLPPANSLDNDIFKETEKPESMEELSSKIESSLPTISQEDAAELAETVYLIKQLEREILLTNEILKLREKGGPYEEIPPLVIEDLMPETLETVEETPGGEIVVAEQISEEPRENIPREEESLITELEKKGKIEKITTKPVSEGIDGVYPKKILGENEWDITIESEQTLLVPATGLKRFMVTDPNVLQSAAEGDKISVTGAVLGRTFLHVWDSEGLRTIKVTVRPKGYREFLEIQKKVVKAEKMDSFKARYSFDRYRVNSKSLAAYRSFHNTNWSHKLDIDGETPWGVLRSGFKYEGKEEGGGAKLLRDLTGWHVNLTGDDLDMAIGGIGGAFSDITLPGTGFQGARLRNPDKKNINYDLLWGARGSRMWGYRVTGWRDTNYFCGGRFQIEPNDFIHFNTTLLRSLEDGYDIGEYVYAAGTGVKFLNDAVKIESEFARNKSEETDMHNHAYKIDTSANLKDYNLLLKATYRDIDPDFLTVTGSSIPYVGDLGYYFNADYNPLRYLRLTGRYNVFRSRINFNPSDPEVYNYDWNLASDFNIGSDTDFRYSIWRRNSEGEGSPSHGRGESYSLSHSLQLPQPMRYLTLQFQYMPNQYRNLTTHSADYREKRYTCGMRLNALKNLYYDLGHTWYHKHMLESGDQGTLKTLTTGLLYSTQIFDTPFYGSVDLRYAKERDVMENLSLSAGENVISGEAEIKYKPSPDLETYIRVSRSKIHGILDHSHNRRETRIWGGGTYLFDTTLRWGEGGSVKGYVFEDSNENGKKDQYEKGLPGINVYAGKFYSTDSGADGSFEFERLKDEETLVTVDTKMFPEGSKSTTPSSQKVKLERGLVTEVNFGVVAVAEISGRVFNDMNMNGIFDEGDEGVRAILIKLDDGTLAQTVPTGHYSMESVKPGKRTITLDAITLPFNLVALTDTKKTIEVKEGKYYEENFALYALRTIVGTVFIDENLNRQLDAGEKGIADVEVRVDGNATVTDDMGRFFLKKLKGGKQIVEVVIESIPEGYEIFGDAFKEVTLATKGEIREDVNFALKKK